MKFDSAAPGEVRLIHLNPFEDTRGIFVKVHHRELFAQHGISDEFVEDFFTISSKGVLRGMHMQIPPHQHAKLVTCIHGSILDVVLDLRKNSPTFGRHMAMELTEKNRFAVYIPAGFAHGFLALSDSTSVYYKTTAVHHPEADCGVRFDSFGFEWPIAAPILSERDQRLPAFADFASPF